MSYKFTATLACLFFVLSGYSFAQQEEITYYHYDALGSPVLATDEAGNVRWREAYSPFGSRLVEESRELDCTVTPCEPTNSPWENRLFYTGKYDEPEIGLIYFGARWYDPSLGRFLSVDPIEFYEGNIFSFNRYAYANNNPYSYVDPDGRAVETAWDVFNVGIGVASFVSNFNSGNYSAAFVDAVGVALDSTAAVVPFLPAGVGAGIRTARGGAAVTKSKAAVPEYPPNRGFIGNPSDQVLSPGTRIDRYGYDGGTFVSPAGTPAPMRSMKPGTESKPFSEFEVQKPLTVKGGKAAPYYGQPGMGTQYELPNSVGKLIDSGALKRVD